MKPTEVGFISLTTVLSDVADRWKPMKWTAWQKGNSVSPTILVVVTSLLRCYAYAYLKYSFLGIFETSELFYRNIHIWWYEHDVCVFWNALNQQLCVDSIKSVWILPHIPWSRMRFSKTSHPKRWETDSIIKGWYPNSRRQTKTRVINLSSEGIRSKWRHNMCLRDVTITKWTGPP